MRLFFQQYKYQVFLFLVLLIAELIVNPFGEFPLNDDWSYAQSVLALNKTNRVYLGNFPSMTLFTHLLWGSLFTHLFGFSIFVLRISTIVSALIGLLFFFKLIEKLTGNIKVAFIASLILLFNPIYFNLVNTYMTDINFNTLTIICVYLIFNYFESKRYVLFYLFVVCSVFLVLLRQYGIVMPFCFLMASIFDKQNRIKSILLALISIVAVYFSLSIYETYLKTHLPEISAYKFSTHIKFFEWSFWVNLFDILNFRYKEIVQHILVFTAPLAFLFLRNKFLQINGKLLLIIILNSFLLLILFFSGNNNNSINIFSNLMVGPETFYESFKGARHNNFPWFETVFLIVKLIFSFVTLLVISIKLVEKFSSSQLSQSRTPMLVFLFSFCCFYMSMILLTESYFDRYHIPLITICLILMAWLFNKDLPKLKLPLVALLVFVLISVLGTKDYLEWNRQKLKAYNDLREQHIDKERINAGFELKCWNEGEGLGWKDFLSLDDFDYLIQFNGVDDFELIREYKFQRYLPYRTDKVCVYKKVIRTEN